MVSGGYANSDDERASRGIEDDEGALMREEDDRELNEATAPPKLCSNDKLYSATTAKPLAFSIELRVLNRARFGECSVVISISLNG